MNPMSKRYRAIAQYYDAEYADSEMLQRDVPFFLRQLPKRRQSVLELCVGTARAAIPIAQAGHRVVGVDYADDLLAIAEQKRKSVGLTSRQLDLRKADVRKLKLGKKFDWICIFFNTFLAFPTLAELNQVLQGIRRHLKPRGRLWIDIFQPDMSLLSGPQQKGFDPHLFYVPALDRTVYQTTEIQRNISRQSQRISFHYSWFDSGGIRHREKNSFEMTWLFPRELELLLTRNGLSIERIYGDHDGGDLTDASPRLIARVRLT
jgi:ubiquinone/menaquinone biosynthesis C-methylase UbiE